MGYRDDACAAVIKGLEAIGLEFFIHIPDSFGAPVVSHFENMPGVRSFPVAREEEGIGIAAGLAMTGKKGALFYQDTGLGNSMTALTTYAVAYHTPMLVLAICRGGIGEYNTATHTFSELAEDMVQAMHLKSYTLDKATPLGEWPGIIKGAFDSAHTTHRPIIVFLDMKE